MDPGAVSTAAASLSRDLLVSQPYIVQVIWTMQFASPWTPSAMARSDVRQPDAIQPLMGIVFPAVQTIPILAVAAVVTSALMITSRLLGISRKTTIFRRGAGDFCLSSVAATCAPPPCRSWIVA